MSTSSEKTDHSNWVQSARGQYVLRQQQALFDHAVGDVFGFNALQYGMPEANLLACSRIPSKFYLDDLPLIKADGNQVQANAHQLPIVANSIDLFLLPHVLEFSQYPHEILREAERVLVPEGHLMITGFNPVSLWGGRKIIKSTMTDVQDPKMLSLLRLKDWLALLGFEVTVGRMACYAPPFRTAALIDKFAFMDKAGDRWWPILGGMYFVVAKKRVVGMRLLKPKWRKHSLSRILSVAPSKKDELQD